MSKRHGSGVTEGLASKDDYLFDLDGLHNVANLAVSNCPPVDIPEWLHEYQVAATDIELRLAKGDFECAPNELLHLRSRILGRIREMKAVGKRLGYYVQNVRWFVRDDE